MCLCVCGFTWMMMINGFRKMATTTKIVVSFHRCTLYLDSSVNNFEMDFWLSFRGMNWVSCLPTLFNLNCILTRNFREYPFFIFYFFGCFEWYVFVKRDEYFLIHLIQLMINLHTNKSTSVVLCTSLKTIISSRWIKKPVANKRMSDISCDSSVHLQFDWVQII